MKRGRPLTYKPEIAATICARLAEGESLRAICRDEGMPPVPTVLGWVVADVQGFAEQYARARDAGLDVMAEQVIEIADERPNLLDNGATDSGDVAHKRIRFDARRWYLSKLAPKRYGDRLDIGNADNKPFEVTDSERAKRLAEIIAAAQQRKAAPAQPAEDDGSDLV